MWQSLKNVHNFDQEMPLEVYSKKKKKKYTQDIMT